MFLLVILTMILAACGNEVEEKNVSTVESSEKREEASKSGGNEEDEQEEATEINKVLVDNEHVKATLVDIVKVDDKDWDEQKYEINIEIENKRDDTIEVQAHEVSADGKMIDDMVFFSETVAGGKFSDATMIIQNYDGDLPEMEENLEFILNVFSFDDFEYEDKHDVKIEFN